MSNYIDLVLVEHPGSNKRYLFNAPPCQVFAGDEVVCLTSNGEQCGKVIATMFCLDDSEAYRFAISACGAAEPLKDVIWKIERIPVAYPAPQVETQAEEDPTDVPF